VKRLLTAWALSLCFAVSAAPTASAVSFSTRSLSDARVGQSKPELLAQMAHSGKVVSFFTRGPHRWMVLPRHASCWSHVPGVKLRHVCNRARLALIAHRWLLAVAHARYVKLYEPKPDDWAEFACIHSHEGAATSNTGNGYYGGLQEDMGFQRTYGPDFMARWGTADRWPVWAQVESARRARDGFAGHGARGYGPWPQTARACGMF
jgi:hypothetical protein